MTPSLHSLALNISSPHLLLPYYPSMLLHLHFSLHMHLVLPHNVLFALPYHFLMHITPGNYQLIAGICAKNHFVFGISTLFLFLL
jgi:hypothetical protein